VWQVPHAITQRGEWHTLRNIRTKFTLLRYGADARECHANGGKFATPASASIKGHGHWKSLSAIDSINPNYSVAAEIPQDRPNVVGDTTNLPVTDKI
jgi:hypothetical protein